MFLVHFKSRDLSALHKQGRFWHIFFTHGGVAISQNEEDVWTIHLPVPLDVDVNSLDAEKAVAEVLGGSMGPRPIKIDEILVHSMWQPSIAVAERYNSDSLRVFLSGDSAHQNIPTGGYGMNTAVGDSFDLGWKLSAVINGSGGDHLLRSYQVERRPIAVRNVERSGEHFKVHRDYGQWVADAGPVFQSSTPEREALEKRIRDHVHLHDGENKDHGIELGYRYRDSPIIMVDEDEPEWSFRSYIPTTWPGSRVPHVFLQDSKTSVFDLFASGFTLVDFSKDGGWADMFLSASKRVGVQLKSVHLPHETHARSIWGRDAVLVRPDDHAAWRSSADATAVDPDYVLKVAAGFALARDASAPSEGDLQSVTV